MHEVARFMKLFVGNDRSYGKYYSKDGEWHMATVKDMYTVEQVVDHLDGKVGLGMVPIINEGNNRFVCRFGAIDIDAHGEDDAPVDHVALAAKIEELKLPLTVCKSRSQKGAHCYLFLRESVEASIVVKALERWADLLGYRGAEVFPKQVKLRKDALGNWINLPYFGGTRVAIEGGKEASLQFFFECAEERQLTLADLNEIVAGDDYAEAPPCLQRLVGDYPIPKGEGIRNESLALATMFFKRAFPDNWSDRAHAFNTKYMEEPIGHSEAQKTIQSIGKGDYKSYRCKQSPMSELCNRETCLTRKFGVGKSKEDSLVFPTIQRMVHYVTPEMDEHRWEVTVDGVSLFMTVDDLSSAGKYGKAIMGIVNRCLPILKHDAWMEYINPYMENAEVFEMPSEATGMGFLKARLFDWLRKYTRAVEGEQNREDVLHGNPAIAEIDNERYYIFKMSDFKSYLMKTRSEEKKGFDLTTACKLIGVETRRMRIPGMANPTTVWAVPEHLVRLPDRRPFTMDDDL